MRICNKNCIPNQIRAFSAKCVTKSNWKDSWFFISIREFLEYIFEFEPIGFPYTFSYFYPFFLYVYYLPLRASFFILLDLNGLYFEVSQKSPVSQSSLLHY